MKKYISFILLVILAIAIMAGAGFAYKKLTENYAPIEIVEEEKEEKVNVKKATDFTVLDNDGKEVNLSDYFGKPIVVNFWATWCPPCKSELPHFDKVYEEMKDEVHFLMVNLTDGQSDTVEGVKTFISQSGYKFPVYFDVNGDAAYGYNLYAIPKTVFIDSEGNIVSSYSGVISESNLRKNIDNIIK